MTLEQDSMRSIFREIFNFLWGSTKRCCSTFRPSPNSQKSKLFMAIYIFRWPSNSKFCVAPHWGTYTFGVGLWRPTNVHGQFFYCHREFFRRPSRGSKMFKEKFPLSSGIFQVSIFSTWINKIFLEIFNRLCIEFLNLRLTTYNCILSKSIPVSHI